MNLDNQIFNYYSLDISPQVSVQISVMLIKYPATYYSMSHNWITFPVRKGNRITFWVSVKTSIKF